MGRRRSRWSTRWTSTSRRSKPILEATPSPCSTPPSRTSRFSRPRAARCRGRCSTRRSRPASSALVDRARARCWRASSRHACRRATGSPTGPSVRSPTAQLDYAAADVGHLLELRDQLASQLERWAALEWAETECAELIDRVRQRGDVDSGADTAWWRLKEARRLKGASRAWPRRWPRGASARPWSATSRPLRAVRHGRDRARVPAARRAGDLRDVRGLDARFHRQPAARRAARRVEAGRELKPPELRLPPADAADPRCGPTVTLVAAWISPARRALRIDPTRGGVALRHRAVAAPGGTTGRLGRAGGATWSASRCCKLVAGRASVALDGSGALVLEERSYRKISRPEARHRAR